MKKLATAAAFVASTALAAKAAPMDAQTLAEDILKTPQAYGLDKAYDGSLRDRYVFNHIRADRYHSFALGDNCEVVPPSIVQEEFRLNMEAISSFLQFDPMENPVARGTDAANHLIGVYLENMEGYSPSDRRRICMDFLQASTLLASTMEKNISDFEQYLDEISPQAGASVETKDDPVHLSPDIIGTKLTAENAHQTVYHYTYWKTALEQALTYPICK